MFRNNSRYQNQTDARYSYGNSGGNNSSTGGGGAGGSGAGGSNPYQNTRNFVSGGTLNNQSQPQRLHQDYQSIKEQPRNVEQLKKDEPPQQQQQKDKEQIEQNKKQQDEQEQRQKMQKQDMQQDQSSSAADALSDDGSVSKKPWIRKGKKLSPRIRRSRQNKRLRKLLTPKNALMSLNELSGTSVSDYTLFPEDNGFLAEVLVNSIRYEGRGPSKTAAKNNASEKALRDQIIQKMLTAPKAKPKVENTSDGDVEMEEQSEEVEVPMVHLASYALYKLFHEWQMEGFEIPDFKNIGVERQSEPPKRPGRTELPANANSMHPTMLLALMRPNTQYIPLGTEGTPPNMLHKIGITVDEKSFTGESRNKKTARKNAAIEACNTLFGTTFEIEILLPVVPPPPPMKLKT